LACFAAYTFVLVVKITRNSGLLSVVNFINYFNSFSSPKCVKNMIKQHPSFCWAILFYKVVSIKYTNIIKCVFGLASKTLAKNSKGFK